MNDIIKTFFSVNAHLYYNHAINDPCRSSELFECHSWGCKNLPSVYTIFRKRIELNIDLTDILYATSVKPGTRYVLRNEDFVFGGEGVNLNLIEDHITPEVLLTLRWCCSTGRLAESGAWQIIGNFEHYVERGSRLGGLSLGNQAV
ncbi:hypothetical protein J6590_036236 [Homalodisca vitripennis]|nr:hypothetical protein J6590_036236 [Homalodisca vitripennis]